MSSSKRLLYIIFAVALLGAVVMIYSLDISQSAVKQSNSSGFSEREFTETVSLKNNDGAAVWIVGDPQDADSQDADPQDGDPQDASNSKIYENVCRFCEDIHLPTNQSKYMSMDEAEVDDLIIFCDSDLEQCVQLPQLERFVAKGGKVILAAGLEEDADDSAIWPMLGIEEKSSGFDSNELMFEKPFLPLQPEQALYGGESDSVRIELNDDATVFIRDEQDGTPLVYTHPWKRGCVCLINGVFLNDPSNMGFLTGSLSALFSDFIYPVLGVKVAFLDNFPIAPSADDALYQSLYGSSVRGFIRDDVWPVLQGTSIRTNTPYTSSILAESSHADDFGVINDGLLGDIGNLILQFDGELIYASDCSEDGKIVFNDELLDLFSKTFANYSVQGLALETDSYSSKMLSIPGADIWAVRGMLGSSELSFSWNDGLLVFPAATQGISMEEGNLVSICSTICAYGMISHVFDMDTLSNNDGDASAWDLAKKQLGIFESDILAHAQWLEKRTLNQTRDDVKSYLELDYGWSRQGNQIELACSNIVKGQAFIYHTDDLIVAAENLSYEQIGDGYYLLRVQENNASITLEERDKE